MNEMLKCLLAGCALAVLYWVTAAHAKTLYCDQALGDRCERAAVMLQDTPAQEPTPVGFTPRYDNNIEYMGPISDYCARYQHLCVFNRSKK